MFQLFLIISFFIFLILISVGTVHFLQKKGYFINRWLFGLASFLVVILPLTFLQQLPPFFVKALYLLSGILAVMFFETTRLKLEKGEFKGVVKSKHFPKTNRKL